MIANGPDEARRNTHSDSLPHLTACAVPAGISEYEPGPRAVSPEPAYCTTIVPEITMTLSTDGCLCAGGAYPAGNLRSIPCSPRAGFPQSGTL